MTPKAPLEARPAGTRPDPAAGPAKLLDLASIRPPREGDRDGGAPVLLSGCTGSSMTPTLDETDLLEIQPYGSERPVRVGDVILFLPPGGDHLVVHRVLRLTPEGIRTRGDANVVPEMDPWSLQPSDVTGRVTAAWRGSKRRKITSGWAGRILARWLLARRSLDRGATRWLHWPYHALARWGIVARLVPRGLRPRVVVFHAGAASQRRLLLGRRAIGHFDAQRGEWVIRRPFRLLVEERVLREA